MIKLVKIFHHVYIYIYTHKKPLVEKAVPLQNENASLRTFHAKIKTRLRAICNMANYTILHQDKLLNKIISVEKCTFYFIFFFFIIISFHVIISHFLLNLIIIYHNYFHLFNHYKINEEFTKVYIVKVKV